MAYTIAIWEENIRTILIIVVFAFFLLLPGLLISILSKKKPKYSDLALYFVISLVIYSPIFSLAYLINISLLNIAFLQTVIILIVGIFYLLKCRNHIRTKPIVASFVKLIALIFTLFAMTVVINKVFPAYLGSDSPYHLAHVRNMVTQNRVINEEAMVIMEDQSKINPGYKDNHWYANWASLSKVTNTDPQKIAQALNPLLILLALAAVIFLVSSLQGTLRAKLSTGIVYATLLLTFHPLDAVVAFWPNRIGYLIFLPTITGLFIRYLNAKERKEALFYLLVGSLGIATASGIHNMALLLSVASCGTFGLFYLLFRDSRGRTIKRVLTFFLITLLATAPLLIQKINSASEFSSYIAAKESISNTTNIFGGFYYNFSLRPTNIVLIAIALGLLTFFANIIRKEKTPDWLILLISGTSAFLFFRQNPFIAPLMTRIFSDTYMERFVLIVPVVIILAFVYDYWMPKKFGALKSSIPLFVLATLLYFSSISFASPPLSRYQKYPDFFNDMKGVSEYINTNLPPKTHIASEIYSSYALTGKSDVRVIVVPIVHASNYVRAEMPQRVADNDRIFKPSFTEKSTRGLDEVLNKYEIKYILVPLDNYYISKNDPAYNEKVVIETLKKDVGISTVYNDTHYILYKYIESEKIGAK